MSDLSGVFFVAVAGVCMARGLSKGDARKVYSLLSSLPLPGNVGEAYDQIDAAISKVRDERQARR